MRAQASSGKPHGRRLYGYDRVYDPTTGELMNNVPNPVEAPIVAEVGACRFAARQVGLRHLCRPEPGAASNWNRAEWRGTPSSVCA